MQEIARSARLGRHARQNRRRSGTDWLIDCRTARQADGNCGKVPHSSHPHIRDQHQATNCCRKRALIFHEGVVRLKTQPIFRLPNGSDDGNVRSHPLPDQLIYAVVRFRDVLLPDRTRQTSGAPLGYAERTVGCNPPYTPGVPEANRSDAGRVLCCSRQ